MPDFRAALRQVQQKGKDAEEYIEQRQKELFQQQGIEGSFGIQELSKIQQRHGKDGTVMSLFSLLISTEEKVLDEVELSPEEFEAKQVMLTKLSSFQYDMVAFADGLPGAEQKAAFQQALSEAGESTAAQVPGSTSSDVMVAAAGVEERLRLIRVALRARGFPVRSAPAPDEADPAAARSAAAQGGAVSSTLNAEDQMRFLARTARRG